MDRVYIKAYSKGKLFDISLFYLECTVALQIKGPQCDYLSKEVMLFDTFPKMAVVVNKKALGILLSQWAVRGDILTFVSTPGSNSRGGLLIPISASVTLELLLDSPLKKQKVLVVPCEWTQALCVCVCYLAPQTLGFLIRLLYFPFSHQNPPSPTFFFQEHWWSWSRHAATMPATLTASFQCSCAHCRRWCGNTWALSRPIQGSLKQAQVHEQMWIQLDNI